MHLDHRTMCLEISWRKRAEGRVVNSCGQLLPAFASAVSKSQSLLIVVEGQTVRDSTFADERIQADVSDDGSLSARLRSEKDLALQRQRRGNDGTELPVDALSPEDGLHWQLQEDLFEQLVRVGEAGAGIKWRRGLMGRLNTSLEVVDAAVEICLEILLILLNPQEQPADVVE